MRLNIGCGAEVKDGYFNIDRLSGDGIDLSHDLNNIPYPIESNSATEIYASHILEHLDRPFEVMREFHRILKNDALLIVRVPHFSRGFTHAEHSHGFDVTFPLYFNPNFTRSGYMGVEYKLIGTKLKWLAFFHLYHHLGLTQPIIAVLRVLNFMISFLANLSPSFCSRIWCFWVGGFEEVEFHFLCVKQ